MDIFVELKTKEGRGKGKEKKITIGWKLQNFYWWSRGLCPISSGNDQVHNNYFLYVWDKEGDEYSSYVTA